MKKQVILAGFHQDSKAHLNNQLIISRMDDIKELQERIKQNEGELFKEVKQILLNDQSLKEFASFFNLMVSNHVDEPTHQENLLDTICLLVSRSVVRLYGKEESESNAKLNYAGGHFLIARSEVSKHLNIDTSVNLFELFEKLNEAMSRYDICVHQFNDSETRPLRVHIRILK